MHVNEGRGFVERLGGEGGWMGVLQKVMLRIKFTNSTFKVLNSY